MNGVSQGFFLYSKVGFWHDTYILIGYTQGAKIVGAAVFIPPTSFRMAIYAFATTKNATWRRQLPAKDLSTKFKSKLLIYLI